jgi:hypothetical protein
MMRGQRNQHAMHLGQMHGFGGSDVDDRHMEGSFAFRPLGNPDPHGLPLAGGLWVMWKC